MKELSIEQKAKRYDEILARAVGANLPYYNDAIMSKVKEFVEYLLPELKESEVERIRKALIELVHDTTGDSLWVDYNVHKEDALAWLEKQGEYANFRNKIQIGDKVTRNKDGVLVNMSQLNRVAKIDEKQGEQSKNEDKDILHRFSFYSYKDEPNILYLAGLYVDDEYRNKGIGTKILKVANEVAASIKCNSIRLKTEKGSHAEKLYRENGYTTIFEEENQIWLEKQAEQKPTIEMITPEESLGVDSDTYNKIVDECIYGEQKPTWSEEDENRFNNLIFLVEFSDENKATKEGFIKFINKLKSLKERYTWKPSESDILLLERIANGKSNPQDFQASLWGLIGQLKKLRE